MTTVPFTPPPLTPEAPLARGTPRPQVITLKSVRVETAPIDLDAEQFFDPDIAQLDFGAEVVQQRELAGLVGGLEDRLLHAEGLNESIRELGLKLSLVIEEPDILRTLPALHHDPLRTSI